MRRGTHEKNLRVASDIDPVCGLTLPAGASGAGSWGGVTVSTGDKTTAAIQSDGSLWMWGSNKDGQLGNNGVEMPIIPMMETILFRRSR